MIDFTNCRINPYKAYGGANGNKICIYYNGVEYMLKFPPKPSRNKKISYTNGCISEYIACHIYESMGFNTQNTILGTYTTSDNKKKTVVACEDFTVGGNTLIEFAKLKNTCIDSELAGFGVELSSIMQAINEQHLIPSEVLRCHFWDMFIADALLGNFDRHNGNWGVLVNEATQNAEIAPIFDCGSCLYPQLSVEEMRSKLDNRSEIDMRIFVFPSSIIEENGKKIPYFDYISSLKNPDCNAALKRVSKRIDWNAITQLIDEIPILDIQKEFYTTMLYERKTRILDFSLQKLRHLEHDRSEAR